ncbi:hypothetical protein FRC12_003669 [Ceratobasidium sp. 428]|nr:hypothetical protein FRC12_003669 [Ceratobasidium sp. 428]
MGDVCTGAPTFTSFSASTQQTFSVSQSASQSLSVGEQSIISRPITISGIDVSFDLSTIPGATATVDINVPVTVPAQRVVSVPVLTLFAPCSSSETPTSSSTPVSTPESSSSSTSSSRETTPTSESRTSASNTRTSEQSSASSPASSSERQNSVPAPTPSRTISNNNNNPSETGTILTTTSAVLTTLPNGSQSTFIATLTTSIPPNGSLNNNDHTGGGGGAGSRRAVAIGVGVTGGVIALIILVMGITWHIRRKRRNSLDLDMNAADVWAPDRESKALSDSIDFRTRPAVIPEYTYNPYTEARTTAYAPVPTMSPPRARPMSLAGHTPQTSISSAGNGGLTVAPTLGRTKTADQILYEAAREDLPRSRATSATASSHTRGYGSLTASSHGAHSGRTDSVVGLLEAHHSGGAGHAHDEIGRRMYASDVEEEERPASPVSIAAPKLAIVNPDADKDP